MIVLLQRMSQVLAQLRPPGMSVVWPLSEVTLTFDTQSIRAFSTSLSVAVPRAPYRDSGLVVCWACSVAWR
jgi:hypothetical protein